MIAPDDTATNPAGLRFRMRTGPLKILVNFFQSGVSVLSARILERSEDNGETKRIWTWRRGG